MGVFAIQPVVFPCNVDGFRQYFMRSMSGLQRERYFGFRVDGVLNPLHAGYAIAWCLCDHDGKPIAPDTEESAKEAMALPCKIVDELYMEAMKASGMTGGAAEGN